MSELTSSDSDNSGKSPARLDTENKIKDRLKASSRRRKFGVGWGLLFGVGAALAATHPDAPEALATPMVLAPLAIGAGMHVEGRRAARTCDELIFQYKRRDDVNPDASMPNTANPYSTGTTLRLNNEGGFETREDIDPAAFAFSLGGLTNIGPFAAESGSCLVTLTAIGETTASTPEMTWAIGGLGAAIAMGGVAITLADEPKRRIPSYMRQLDNLDGGNPLRMEVPPPSPS